MTAPLSLTAVIKGLCTTVVGTTGLIDSDYFLLPASYFLLITYCLLFNKVAGTTGFIDPLLNDTQRASPMTDGYAFGITLLMCLVGSPVLDIKSNCRKLLQRPTQPSEWEVIWSTMRTARLL